MPQGIWLAKFGEIVADYFGHTAYHVGSSLHRKHWLIEVHPQPPTSP